MGRSWQLWTTAYVEVLFILIALPSPKRQGKERWGDGGTGRDWNDGLPPPAPVDGIFARGLLSQALGNKGREKQVVNGEESIKIPDIQYQKIRSGI